MPYPVAAVRGKMFPAGAVAGVSGYRKEITVDHLQVVADLTNFPVLLSLASDADLAAHTDGDDIYITQSDGSTVVPHEIEEYDPDTGKLVLWFKAPSLSSVSDDTFYIYYGSGAANSENPSGVWDANHLTVQHFPFMWKPYASNPVLSPDHRVSTVLKSGSTYHMYYSYGAAGSARIGHATSSDGLAWTVDTANNPVVDVSAGKFDSNQVWFGRAWIEGSTWYMLYAGYNGTANAIGLATSSDGVTWTKQNSGNPVLQGTAAQWDVNDAELGWIMKVGSTYYLYYNTKDAGANRSVGIATSTDLISWSKDVNNPIFTGGRFCGSVFKLGSYYYYVLPRYSFSTSYEILELWRDSNPTFYSGDRTYLGEVHPISLNGWDEFELDNATPLTDTVERDSFADTPTAGEMWLYFRGDEDSNASLNTGLVQVPIKEFAMKGEGWSSTGSNHATLGQQQMPALELVNGNVGGAIEGDGTRTRGKGITNISGYSDLNDPFTWEVIVNSDDVTNVRQMVTHRDGSTASTSGVIMLFFSSGAVRINIRRDGGTLKAESAGAVSIATTYRIALTRQSDGTLAIWINGTENVLTITENGAITPDQLIYLGVQRNNDSPTGLQFLDGRISEFRISDIARSDAWLGTAYNIEVAGGVLSLGAEEEV